MIQIEASAHARLQAAEPTNAAAAAAAVTAEEEADQQQQQQRKRARMAHAGKCLARIAVQFELQLALKQSNNEAKCASQQHAATRRSLMGRIARYLMCA